MSEFFTFLREQSGKLLEQTLTHIGLTFLSLCLALLIGLPLGIYISRHPRLASTALAITGILQTVPSIALLGFLIPWLGIGAGPAIVALFLYALLPIVRNTFTGISEVDKQLKEAATAMGMTPGQQLFRIELPLAMPVIFAGIRTAAVINVGVATLAAYIAAGGLGEFIFGGIALNNPNMILAGAIPAALLAMAFDFSLARLQKSGRTFQRKNRWWLACLLPAFAALYLVPRVQQTRLLAGFAHEFIGRQDGYPGLQQRYGLHISTALIDQNLMYEAIHRRKVDVISGYSTDGRLEAYHLKVLQDDKRAFPPYYAAPIVRQTTLKKYPELERTLNLLAGRLNDSMMTHLNYRVDFLHQTPERVARECLVQLRLYQPSKAKANSPMIVLGSKIFTEQYILAQMYKMLIEGYLPLRVDTRTGLGGTKICFDALRTGAIDLYPEYTGTGLLVLLQPSAALTDSLLPSKERVYGYVQKEFARQFQLQWLDPLGFNNAYALVMREEQANQLSIQTISQLQQYLADRP